MSASKSTADRCTISYLIETCDAAYMGICCAKELASSLREVIELATLSDNGTQVAAQRLSQVLSIAQSGLRNAEEHLYMLTEVKAEADEALEEARESCSQG